MAVLSNTGILAGASAAGDSGYKVEKGLMLDSAQSKHLSWEPTTKTTAAGSEVGCREFTISFWTKVDGRVDGTKSWCSAGASSQANGILQLYIEYGKVTINCYNAYMQSARVLADPSAWYHIVLAADTDQVEPIDRFKVWVNNERITDWGSPTYPYRGHPILWNTNVPHQIGAMRNASSANSSFGDGYLAEFYNIDAQTLDPSYFGETDDNGKWVPKAYKGTYGLQVDNSEDWSGNNDPTDPPLSSSDNAWDATGLYTAEQLFTYDLNAASGTAFAGSVGQALTWEPDSAYTFTDKVEIRTGSFSATWAQVATLTYSDDTTTSTTFTDWGWTTIATGGGTIKKIVMQAGAGDYNYWNAIRIDGKVLIDSVHTVIDNSFYLKFSGGGKMYSDDIVGTEYDQTYYHKGMMFDGDTATSYLAWNGEDVVWTPSGGLAFDSTLRIETGDGDIVFNWDGGSYTLPTSGGKTWYDVSSNVTSPITSVTWTCSALGSGPYVYRVEVDGEVLIEADDIETDSSGNNNHVKSNNLIADSGTNYSGGTVVGAISSTFDNAFDGLNTTGAYTYANTSATLTLPSPKDWNSKFEVYIMYYGGTLEVNGSDVGSGNISSGGATDTWYDITSIVGSSGTLTSIGVSDTPTGYYTSLKAVRLDGVVLIDGPGAADLVPDSPTDFDNKGDGVGNYCTLNSISSGVTLSEGNLKATQAVADHERAHGTLAVRSGKWYWEVTKHDNAGTTSGTSLALGVANTNAARAYGFTTVKNHLTYLQGGATYYDNDTYPATTASGDVPGGSEHSAGVWMFAFDFDNGKGWVGKDGTWLKPGGTGGDPVAGTDPIFTQFTSGDYYTPMVHVYEVCSVTANFGQRPFAYTPPTDYKVLNSYNLSTPTITDPSEHFKVVTYDGTASTKVITGDEAGNDFKFSPDMAWMKTRDEVRDHMIHDTVRGDNKALYLGSWPTALDAEATVNGVEFGTNSYTLGTDAHVNSSGKKMVAWNWNAGSAAAPTTSNAGAHNGDVYNTDSWISNTTMTGEWLGHVLTTIFDGDTIDGGIHGALNSTLHLQWPAGTINGNVRLMLMTHGSGVTHKYKDNGGTAIDITSSVTGTMAWVDLGNVNLTDYEGTCTISGNAAAIEAIELDGKILVDSGQIPPAYPSLTSTYKANPTAGFSIVTYEGNVTSGATFAHGLGAKPDFGFFKNRETAGYSWYTYNKNAGNTHNFFLNYPNPKSLDSGSWNNTDPNSNVMTIGNAGDVNQDTKDIVAYLWSEVEGYSRFGTYTGNGRDDGPFIYCGFKPAFVMCGPNASASDWYIYDTARWPINPAEDPLAANEDDTEANFDARPGENDIHIVSNGFKIRFADASGYHNYLGWDYSFVAFAESPFKHANAH